MEEESLAVKTVSTIPTFGAAGIGCREILLLLSQYHKKRDDDNSIVCVSKKMLSYRESIYPPSLLMHKHLPRSIRTQHHPKRPL